MMCVKSIRGSPILPRIASQTRPRVIAPTRITTIKAAKWRSSISPGLGFPPHYCQSISFALLPKPHFTTHPPLTEGQDSCQNPMNWSIDRRWVVVALSRGPFACSYETCCAVRWLPRARSKTAIRGPTSCPPRRPRSRRCATKCRKWRRMFRYNHIKDFLSKNRFYDRKKLMPTPFDPSVTFSGRNPIIFNSTRDTVSLLPDRFLLSLLISFFKFPSYS